MSRALVNMSKDDRKAAIGRRLSQNERLKYNHQPIGLGVLAALDAIRPSRELGANKGVETKTPKKLEGRQQAWKELKRYQGDAKLGVGKRYPEGYRYPGSNK